MKGLVIIENTMFEQERKLRNSLIEQVLKTFLLPHLFDEINKNFLKVLVNKTLHEYFRFEVTVIDCIDIPNGVTFKIGYTLGDEFIVLELCLVGSVI